ncbi:MAG TPA: type II toxin-antitoxin system RelE/ParE family toxin [Xanthobacteraceae bacterium]|nr:type II toxin-antitoxin system RelE/ParE family toxin [Xanthobacteraceae bacterium]
MKLVFDAKALQDLEGIFDWIAEDSPANARGVIERILASVERLGAYPEMARAGRVAGTREWVVPRLPYIVVYEVRRDRDELVVTAVFHEKQDR